MSVAADDITRPGEDTGLDLWSLYCEMLRIRLIEETIAERYAEQKMRCPVHLSVGQEAVPVGVTTALRRSDQIVSTHRCHAHYLAKGGDLKAMMAEIYGKATGCCGGRGGSMHLFDNDAGALISLPIVASSIPLGAGAALAMQQQGKDDIAVIYTGDASLEEGVFHETANFAAVKNLPVIFVCENNLYSVYTNLADRQPDRPLTRLADAHAIPTEHVDGNDVVSVANAAKRAADRARRGEGPSFLQCDTYRWREHCGPNYDNHIGYRSEEEFETWKQSDPLEVLKPRLADLAGEASVTAEIEAEIAAAFDFADASDFPTSESAGKGVYA